MMDIIGSIGTDWVMTGKAGKAASDTLLRAWRDYLEEQLKTRLDLTADFTLADRTRFVVAAGSPHTVTEIESFARRALDTFLNLPQ